MKPVTPLHGLLQMLPTLPILDWGSRYRREALTSDLGAALIVTVMLIPQSLAYALLAGLPPEVGLYASVAPLVFYAVFGTSRVLAVGPVAVVSLMTAAAIGEHASSGAPQVAACLNWMLNSRIGVPIIPVVLTNSRQTGTPHFTK